MPFHRVPAMGFPMLLSPTGSAGLAGIVTVVSHHPAAVKSKPKLANNTFLFSIYHTAALKTRLGFLGKSQWFATVT